MHTARNFGATNLLDLSTRRVISLLSANLGIAKAISVEFEFRIYLMMQLYLPPPPTNKNDSKLIGHVRGTLSF